MENMNTIALLALGLIVASWALRNLFTEFPASHDNSARLRGELG